LSLIQKSRLEASINGVLAIIIMLLEFKVRHGVELAILKPMPSVMRELVVAGHLARW